MTALDVTEPTAFDPALPVTAVEAHPNNPRRRAIADDELVGSVKASGLVQPLIVAPHPDKANKFVLIAGHRRLDALKKAKRTTAPAVVRLDLVTDGQQLEAMLVENGRRKDLSPIEEAEGYQQLTLFGYKQKDIATKVGVDSSTVSSRLRLLKLADTTQGKVHDGQISIDDALAIQSFADDTDATRRLEKAAGGEAFKQVLAEEKKRRSNVAKAAELAKPYADAGIPELPNPKGMSRWDLIREAGATFAHNEPEDHPGCAAYVVEADKWMAHVTLVCTAPDSHPGTADEDDAEWRAARERERAAEQAAAAARAEARTGRLVTIAAAVPVKAKLDPLLRTVLQQLLSLTVSRLDGRSVEVYQDLMDIADEDRWKGYGYSYVAGEADRLTRHRATLTQAPDQQLVEALIAVHVAAAEACLGQAPGSNHPYTDSAAHALAYLNILTGLGHTFTDLDTELLVAATPKDDQ